MKKVITARDVEDLLRRGVDLNSIPADALLTPSARDLVREALETGRSGKAGAPTGRGAPARAASAAGGDQAAASDKPLSSKSPRAELEAFFHSPRALELKQQICEMGRRLWLREYVDGNGGNMAIRVGEDLALCTPTLVSKGALKPEDMCLVDFEGNQLLGTKKRTSEILMHLQIMQRQPKAVATCHAHPPYATGFAVAGIAPPTCMLPEYEVFCAVAVAPYRTPGTPEMGKLVAELVDQHNTILMANHGVVTWSHNNLEEAYWRMEIVEAYCRTLLVTAQLGVKPQTFSPQQLQDLLKIKQSLGYVDPRYGLKECELCDNDEWRPGVTCQVPDRPDAAAAPDPEAEAIVQAVTDRILAQMK